MKNKNAKVILYIGIVFLATYLLRYLMINIPVVINDYRAIEYSVIGFYIRLLAWIFFNSAVLILLIGSMFGKSKVIKIVSILLFILVKFINLISLIIDYIKYFVDYTSSFSFIDKLFSYYSIYTLLMIILTILISISLIILGISLFMKKKSKALMIINIVTSSLSIISLIFAKILSIFLNRDLVSVLYSGHVLRSGSITIFPIIFLLIGTFMVTHAHIMEGNYE